MTTPASTGQEPPRNPYARQSQHISRLWQGKEHGVHFSGLERIVLTAHALFLMVMPSTALRWLGWLGELRGLRTYQLFNETYAVAKPLLLLVILAGGYASHTWAFVAAIFLLVDLNTYLFGVVLFSNFWSRSASYPRSIILLGFNLVEFIAAFAVIYLHAKCLVTTGGANVADWTDAFYFSTATTTTVGFGDITPAPGTGRIVATVQMLFSVGFMAVVVSHFISTVGRDHRVHEEN